ncbi:MAG TPA: hypothetical protein VKT51_11580 [Candidatus Eremiobacteraceae bacterium]|nr:hypothetical protein [Candidatus Eremiobacteraceae bacterium]
MALIGILQTTYPNTVPYPWVWVVINLVAGATIGFFAYRYVAWNDDRIDKILEFAPKARSEFSIQERAAEAAVPSEIDAIDAGRTQSICTPTPATPGSKAEIHIRDLSNQHESDVKVAARAREVIDSLPRPRSLRQQAFDLTRAMQDVLKAVHGSLDADSFVAPEVSKVFTARLLAVKNKIQNFLRRDILRHDAKFPVTVKRMAMFLDDVQQAANDLRDDIPPVP